MAKTPFLLLLMSLIGVVSTPQILAATDTVELARVDMSSAVETVPLPEPEPKTQPATKPVSTVAKAPAAGAPATMRSYTTVVSGEIMDNPGNAIRQTGKFIYGHNTGPLGTIAYLQYGEVFTVNGVAYRVAFKQVYEKSQANGMLNGDKQLTIDVERNALGHSISMMTCTGTMLPGGDATHRLVVFADQI